MRDPLVGKTICELIALAEAHGQPAYRGEQIGEWLYQHSVHSIEDMTSLPMKFRSELAEHYVIDILAGFLYAVIASLAIERVYRKGLK